MVSAPSSSLPRSSCVTTALADDSEGEGYGGRTSARGGSKPLGKAQPPAAAAAAARLGKSKASGGGGAAAARLRKQAAAHVRRPGQGLTLLNHQGRPKFYHSRTCVAMTRQELTGAATVDSDSEGDFAEWQVGATPAPAACCAALQTAVLLVQEGPAFAARDARGRAGDGAVPGGQKAAAS